MAFIVQGNQLLSFADYDDVVERDSRLFDANEGLDQDAVDGALIRSTQRILAQLSGSDWWKSYWISQRGFEGVVLKQSASVPAIDPNLIIARRGDFTELCVNHAMANYLLPRVADFGNPDSAERQKISFYDEKYRALFAELTSDGDWYDFDQSGSVSDAEKYPFPTNLVRRR
jgi:hypothetical protein